MDAENGRLSHSEQADSDFILFVQFIDSFVSQIPFLNKVFSHGSQLHTGPKWQWIQHFVGIQSYVDLRACLYILTSVD